MEIQINWKYKNKTLKEIPENSFGFTYKITNIKTKNFYIGYKQFYSITNPIMSKKRKLEYLDKTGLKRKREKKIKESDWKDYKSSSKKLQQMVIQNPNDFKFEILELFETKAEMLLKEAYYIIKEFLNKNPLILNEWISIKSFKLK